MAQIRAELATQAQDLGSFCALAGFGAPRAMSRFYGYGRGFGFTVVHITHAQSWDLRTWLLLNGWDGVTPVFGSVTINPGVWLADSGAGYALRIASLPAGSSVDLIVYGILAGRGGQGGAGGYSGSGTGGQAASGPTPGKAGGPALVIRNAVRLWDKAGSNILGGGGGAGGGAGGRKMYGSTLYDGGGGGGGSGMSGYPIVIGGGAGGAAWFASNYPQDGGTGGQGTHTSPGTFGISGWPGTGIAGHGGVGGNWGQPGQNGFGTGPFAGFIDIVTGPGAPAGPGGAAIDGWAYVQHIEHAGTFAGALV